MTDRESIKRNSPVGALFLIFLGLMFLANNLGWVSWDVWDILWRFWPVLLILVGVEIIAGQSIIGYLVILLLSIGIFGSILILAIGDNVKNLTPLRQNFNWLERRLEEPENSKIEVRELKVAANEYDVEEVYARQIDMAIGAGKLELTDTVEDDYFTLTAPVADNQSEKILVSKLEEGTLNINMDAKREIYPGLGLGRNLEYKADIGRNQLPTSLDLTIGAGKGVIDLSQLTLTKISANVGAGSLDIMLTPDSLPQEDLSVDVGAGDTTILIPGDTQLTLNAEVGLGQLKAGDEILKSGIHTIGQGANQVNLKVKLGVGNVNVTTIPSE